MPIRPETLTGHAWTARVLAVAALGAALVCGVNYKLNFFGLYGDARGLSRAVYADGSMYSLEQDVKYMLAMNYIPANFDGLLIGCSNTFNWDTSRLSLARVYNLSMGGANISEEKLVAENALRKGKFKVAIFSVYPYLTETHGRRGGGMDPRLYWAGLGSLRLLFGYKEWLLLSIRHEQPFISDFGVHRYPKSMRPRKEWIEGKSARQRREIVIDPEAFREYGELVATARASGARIVRMIPPLYYEHRVANEAAYLDYERKIDTLFLAQDPLVNCNSPAYDTVRTDKNKYYDSFHLTDAAVPELIRLVNEDLRGIGGAGGVR